MCGKISPTYGGEKKYYTSLVHGQEISLEGLIKGIEKTSTVNGADIRAVLYAMIEEVVSGLSDGRIIRLDDLGSLRITLNSEGKTTPDEVTAVAVKKAGVIFTPGKKLQESVGSKHALHIGRRIKNQMHLL